MESSGAGTWAKTHANWRYWGQALGWGGIGNTLATRPTRQAVSSGTHMALEFQTWACSHGLEEDGLRRYPALECQPKIVDEITDTTQQPVSQVIEGVQ